jgi:hypothetical protein
MTTRVLVALVLVAGCDGGEVITDAGSDAGAGPPLFADITFTIRCDTRGGCAAPEAVDICGFANSEPCGESGTVTGTCVAHAPSASTTLIDFDLRTVVGALSVTSLTVPNSGGGAQGACGISVTDSSGATFAGSCGSGCFITNVEFIDDAGGPTITGEIECIDLDGREITGADTLSAGTFRIANCAGLTL